LLGHFNHLLGLGQFELSAERNSLADGSEVAGLDLESVGPRRHEGEAVTAVSSCGRTLRGIRTDVGDRHRRVGHDGAGGIRDRACDDALHGL